MRLLPICITLIQVALAEALDEVTGYVGDTVILPSGADPSWQLSSIKWSIFTNTTLIATYGNRRINVQRFYRYGDRLHLNTSTGDLTIYNVTRDDATLYTVDLFNTERKNSVNKIKLSVREHLQKPNIKIVFRGPIKDGCRIGLVCDSAVEGMSISWKVDPDVKTFDINPDGKSAFVLVEPNQTQHVEFTCISSRNTEEYTSRNASLRCEEDKPKPTPRPTTGPGPEPESRSALPSPPPRNDRNRALSFFLGGFSAAVVLFILLCYLTEKSQLQGK